MQATELTESETAGKRELLYVEKTNLPALNYLGMYIYKQLFIDKCIGLFLEFLSCSSDLFI